PCHELLMPPTGVGQVHAVAPRISIDFERCLARVDPGDLCASLGHLRRPCLAYEPGCSSNHPGHDEEPTAILLSQNPETVHVAGDPTIGANGRVATRPLAFLAEHQQAYPIPYARWLPELARGDGVGVDLTREGP